MNRSRFLGYRAAVVTSWLCLNEHAMVVSAVEPDEMFIELEDVYERST